MVACTSNPFKEDDDSFNPAVKKSSNGKFVGNFVKAQNSHGEKVGKFCHAMAGAIWEIKKLSRFRDN